MPRDIIGLSTTYFGIRRKSIYDSVKAVRDLGFGAVELGAGHMREQGAWDTLRRIKSDFGDMNFTIHGLFPPAPELMWFNMSLGPTPENRKIIGRFFRAAQVVEALAIGAHPGYPTEVRHAGKELEFRDPVKALAIPIGRAVEKSIETIRHALKQSADTGIKFAVENSGLSAPSPPLFLLAENMGKLLEGLPDLGFLLDVGHALYMRQLDELLAFSGRVAEMHIHYSSPAAQKVPTDEHLPLCREFPLEKIKKIRQIREIPLVFEHGLDVKPEEIQKEKKLLEGFLKSL